jgi:hypothetical protein
MVAAGVVWAMTAEDPKVAVANTIPAIRDLFISYLAKKQPRPAAWFFKNRGTSSYQSVGKTHEKHITCTLLLGKLREFNYFFEDSRFTRSS